MPPAPMTACSFSIQRGHDDAVVIAVGNEQSSASFVGQNFAGIPQRCLDRRFTFEFEMNGTFIQQTFFTIIRQALLDKRIERGEFDLAAVRGHQVSFRVDHAQTWPTAATVTIPDFVVGVVHHRMLDLVTHDRLADALGIVLGIELAGMHADDNHVVGIRLFQLLELRQNVHAVDAAVGPEIENDEFAAQVFKIDRRRGVQPLGAPFQRRGRRSPRKWILACFVRLSRRRGRSGCLG